MEKHVALVIKNGENVLFIQRSPNKKILPNTWSFPSGTVENGEGIEDTAHREAFEELGVKIKSRGETIEKEIEEFGVSLIFFPCEIIDGNISIKQPEEINKIEWISFDKFFDRFNDSQIGHGLIWLRKNPDIVDNLK